MDLSDYEKRVPHWNVLVVQQQDIAEAEARAAEKTGGRPMDPELDACLNRLKARTRG